jgi:hypothetical protein
MMLLLLVLTLIGLACLYPELCLVIIALGAAALPAGSVLRRRTARGRNTRSDLADRR